LTARHCDRPKLFVWPSPGWHGLPIGHLGTLAWREPGSERQRADGFRFPPYPAAARGAVW
jgi:hypothetical protein